jgi:hypothetical protein
MPDRRSPVSGSEVTAAVSPTPETPRPDVLIARGAIFNTNRKSCDLAVDGSPTNNTLMSLIDVCLKKYEVNIVRK